MEVKFVRGYPCMLIGRTLILADLHIGYELMLRARDVHVSEIRTLVNSISTIRKKTKARSIIIVGDLKHQLVRRLRDEALLLRGFVRFLHREFEDVLLVKGNHDGKIEEITSKLRVCKFVSFNGDVLLLHGHALFGLDVEHYKTVIMAHVHPAMKSLTRDERVWIVMRNRNGQRLIIMPSFASLVGMLYLTRDSLFSLVKENAIVKKFSPVNCEIYSLFGKKLCEFYELRA